MGGPAFGCRARAKTGPVTLGTTSTIRILTGCLEKTRNVNVASSPGSKVVGRTEKQNYFVSFGDTGQCSTLHSVDLEIAELIFHSVEWQINSCIADLNFTF